MIKGTVNHLQINVNTLNFRFYKDFMEKMGFELIMEEPDILGYKSNNNVSLYFTSPIINSDGNYDTIGFNHLGISVPNMADVNEMVGWVREHDIEPLFETPRHRPEFAEDEDSAYYQLMFESPDKILIEIFYIGKK